MFYIYSNLTHEKTLSLFDNKEEALEFFIRQLREKGFVFEEPEVEDDFFYCHNRIVRDKNNDSIYMEICEINFGDTIFI